MIGGIVRDIWIWQGDRVSVVVQGTGCEANDYLGIRLAKDDNSLCIKRGDSLWWQSDKAYWTPQDKSLSDVVINRIGYSFRVPGDLTDERWVFNREVVDE